MHVVCTFAWVVVSINGAALPEGGELDGETLMAKGDDKATLSGGKLVMPKHDLPSRDGPKMNVMPRLLAHINMQTRAHFCMAVCVRAWQTDTNHVYKDCTNITTTDRAICPGSKGLFVPVVEPGQKVPHAKNSLCHAGFEPKTYCLAHGFLTNSPK